jgi:hypothetical protein
VDIDAPFAYKDGTAQRRAISERRNQMAAKKAKKAKKGLKKSKKLGAVKAPSIKMIQI